MYSTETVEVQLLEFPGTPDAVMLTKFFPIFEQSKSVAFEERLRVPQVFGEEEANE